MRAALVLFGFAVVAALGDCTCQQPVAGGGPDGGAVAEGEGEGGGEGEGSDAGFVGDSGVPAACIDPLAAIALSPADSSVTLDGATAAPISFTATGTLDDGSTVDLDEGALGWTATRDDDGDPGAINGGTYEPNPALGGVVTITAGDGCVSGSTTVTFTVSATLGTPAGDPAEWNATPATTGTLPQIVYPSDQTRFPRNIFQTLFQWHAGGYGEFRLTFAGAGSTVTVFTDGADPQCSGIADAACFTADENAWTLIAGSNAGATVTWTVDALDRSTSPPTVRRAPPITIGFSKRDVRGAIFYWSTTSAGIRRANIGDAQPEDYVTGKPGTQYDPEGQVQCVACHYVSRDGTKIAAPVQVKVAHGAAQPAQSLWFMNVTNTAPAAPVVTDVEQTSGHGFAAFSPDNSLAVAAWGGNMWLVDTTTGGNFPNLDLGGGFGTQPDWSPDGSAIAYADQKGDAPGNAAINLLPATGADSFGSPVTLIEQTGQQSNLFPMFSPDSRWLAFSRGKGGHGDKTMQLFVVDAKGPQPGTPIELVNANRVINNEVTNGQFENAQATWAPPGDLYWIAFNSQRAYGLVSPSGTQQIWVAAIDPAALESGSGDPSFPAFRLQFQGLAENNHRAFWTLDVREEPPPVDGGPADAGPEGPVDAGNLPDAGPEVDAGPQQCVSAGNTCDPVLDCCNPGFFCDSADNGVTYTCIPIGG